MPTRKKYLAILAVAVLAVITVDVTFLLLNSQWFGESVTAKSPAAGYIEDSKIYLLSANSSYGEYKGSQCFIIHVMVRNDYTAQNPPDNLTDLDSGSAFFILTAKAYNQNNTQIETHEYIPPNSYGLSYNQQYLDSSETLSYDVYLTVAQQRKDIDHYDLVVSYLGTIPAP